MFYIRHDIVQHAQDQSFFGSIALMKGLIVLWKFIRPHTAVGTIVSVSCLYLMAVYSSKSVPFNPLWFWKSVWLPAIIAALGCNLFITGLNQYADAELDKSNKPWLPIPSGELSKRAALWISLIALAIALLVSWLKSFDLFLLILVIAGLGAAYSLPPFKLKRHHSLAAAVILLVRGLLVNLGFYGIFSLMIHFRIDWSPAIIWLTVFVSLFSFAIAWFKDVPDTEGDKAFKFATLAVTWGRERAFFAGVLAVSVAYLSVIAVSVLGYLQPVWLFNLSHAAIVAFFLWRSRDIAVYDQHAMKKYYLMVWNLFFIEYFIFTLGVYIS